MIVGYIAGGVLVGNLLPRYTDLKLLAVVADVGVTLLLFTLGVEFSFHRLRRVLHTVAWAASAQILVTILFFILLSMGFRVSFVPAFFFAIAASLSSTAVVVKILSERGELETVPGELTTGWLVIQDLAVIPIMLLVGGVAMVVTSGAGVVSAMGIVFVSLLKAVIFIFAIFLLGRKGIPKVIAAVASLKSREMLLLTTIGFVFFAGLGSAAFGLSAAIGGFIAGLVISETSQNHAVFAEIRPLRDICAVIFFVSLGMGLPIGFLARSWLPIVGLSLAVIVVKWFIVMGFVRFLEYHKKTAFLVALSLTSMSEFGFIVAREGVSRGILNIEYEYLIIAVTFLTIFLASPLVANGQKVYYAFRHTMERWPKIFPVKEEVLPTEGLAIEGHVVICGYGRVGRYIGRALEMAGIPFLVVDYNHATVTELRARGIGVVYGDPADREVLDYAQVDFARAVVIAIPDQHTQEMVIAHVRSLNRRARIICRTHHEEDQKRLKALGVATIVQPEFEAALSIVERLLGDFGVPDEDISGKVARLKIEHGLG